MFGGFIVFLVIALGIIVVGGITAGLSYNGHRPIWHLVVGSLPCLLVGVGYTILIIASKQRPNLGFVGFIGLNLAIVGFCYVQILRRKKPNQTPEPTRFARGSS